MEEIKGEDIKNAKDQQLTIILPPPPNKNHEEKVSYGVFNGIMQKNFTTFGQALFQARQERHEIINQLAKLTELTGKLDKRVAKLEKKKKK